jgi:hypothetical protein
MLVNSGWRDLRRPDSFSGEAIVHRYFVYDIETRSTLNLKQSGSYLYACDRDADVLCVSYCVLADDVCGPITTWVPFDPVPPGVLGLAADPGTLIVAFNDAFERQVEQHILHRRYGWPIFPIERRCCAQAIALTHALPAALDSVAAALRLPVRKNRRRQAGDDTARYAA